MTGSKNVQHVVVATAIDASDAEPALAARVRNTVRNRAAGGV